MTKICKLSPLSAHPNILFSSSPKTQITNLNSVIYQNTTETNVSPKREYKATPQPKTGKIVKTISKITTVHTKRNANNILKKNIIERQSTDYHSTINKYLEKTQMLSTRNNKSPFSERTISSGINSPSKKKLNISKNFNETAAKFQLNHRPKQIFSSLKKLPLKVQNQNFVTVTAATNTTKILYTTPTKIGLKHKSITINHLFLSDSQRRTSSIFQS